MVRYMIAVVLGCVFVTGSVLIVRSEGQAYQDDPAKTKPDAQDDEKSSKPVPKKARATPPKDAAAKKKAAQAKGAAAKKAAGTNKDASAKRPAANKKAKAKASNANAKKRETGGSDEELLAAGPHVKDPIWDEPQLKKAWDVSSLKPDDELRMGAELHNLIVQYNPLIESGPWRARVEDVAEPFLKTLHRKEIQYKFFILNSDAVNAFSHPGGYVYISRGLFDLIAEDEDYALQFAVGHEIAHVDLQHAIRCLQDPDVAKMEVGTLQKLYGLIIPFGYLRSEKDKFDQEFQADEWVYRRMQQFERTRRETLIFLNKMDNYAKQHGFEYGQVKPRPNASPLENHYRAVTAARYRLKHLKEFLEEASKTRK